MGRTELTGKQIKDRSVELDADITGVLPVANGGTGSDTLALNNVLLGNGTGALQAVAPGTAGYVLTSNGSSWVAAPGGTGNVESVNGQDGVVVLTATDIEGAESTVNKGQPDGYASLDGTGRIPLVQLPAGIGVDSLAVFGDSIQLYAGEDAVGEPVSLVFSHIEGGAPGLPLGSVISGGEPGTPLGSVIDGGTVGNAGTSIDGVQVSADYFQFSSGGALVGDPISLGISNADGGTPYSTSIVRIDGGKLL